MKGARSLLLAAVLGALLTPALLVAAEQRARVGHATPLRRGGELVCDLGLTGLFPPAIENTLRSGLPVVIDLACEVRPEGGGRTIGQFQRSEVRYDVWEDHYTLIRDGRSRDFPDFEAVHNACRRLENLVLAPLSALAPAARVSLSLRVAVNPLSGEERERMARWLAETVTDPGDPSSRELRLDLGGLIQSFFRGGDAGRGWGEERRFGPYLLVDLPEQSPARPAVRDSSTAKDSKPRRKEESP